jgi:hypothetical protein
MQTLEETVLETETDINEQICSQEMEAMLSHFGAKGEKNSATMPPKKMLKVLGWDVRSKRLHCAITRK